MDLSQRTKREQESYDEQVMAQGQKKLQSLLWHANDGPARVLRNQTITKQMKRNLDGDILEIGSQTWSGVFCRDEMQPRALTCINISQVELDAGKAAAETKNFKATFRLMDAHQLDYPDELFDLVYGSAILHHLDFKKALKEISRVLRPGGEIMFVEPLRLNPIAQIVRLLTPNARTIDELPLGREELALVDHFFECEHHYSDLFTIPAALLSRFIYEEPVNPITKTADALDRALVSLLPSIGLLFRTVTLMGRKRKNPLG